MECIFIFYNIYSYSREKLSTSRTNRLRAIFYRAALESITIIPLRIDIIAISKHHELLQTANKQGLLSRVTPSHSTKNGLSPADPGIISRGAIDLYPSRGSTPLDTHAIEVSRAACQTKLGFDEKKHFWSITQLIQKCIFHFFIYHYD